MKKTEVNGVTQKDKRTRKGGDEFEAGMFIWNLGFPELGYYLGVFLKKVRNFFKNS